ncbi:MAG: flagellar export chaperone FliS [Planctomycetota bacterium]|jgi:flagellar protein FliS
MKTQKTDSYKKSQVETVDQLSLILMLYNKAILLLGKAREEISEKKYEEKHDSLTKACNIVFELMQSLDQDKGGEIATSLSRLYGFVVREILDADTNLNIKALDTAKTILSELRTSWEGIKDDPNAKIPDTNTPEVNMDLSI